MNLSHDQKIRLDNFQAQYNSMMENIRSANANIELLNIEKKKLAEDTEFLNKERRVAQKELSKIVDERNSLLQDIQSRKRLIAHKEERSAEKVDRAEQRIYGREVELKNREHKAIGTITNLDSEILRLSTMKDGLSEDVNNLKSREEELANSVQSLVEENAALGAELIQKESDYLGNVRSLDDQIASKQKELADLSEQVEAERERVQRPLQFLQEREELLDKREKTVLILQRRLKQLFQTHFPDIALPSTFDEDGEEE